ncbi:MAG: hypothetical protein ACK5VH_06275, partial [bacterium]
KNYTFWEKEKNNPWQGLQIIEEIDTHRFMDKQIMATADLITYNDNASILNAAHFHHDLIAYKTF